MPASDDARGFDRRVQFRHVVRAKYIRQLDRPGNDPTGAAVVGANVSLANVGTGFSQVEKTDSSGVYLFNLVSPGNYSLNITAQGFAGYDQTGIVMNANLYATQNVHLKIARAQGEVVSVTADTELINTTTAELGMTVNEQSVADLPLNGRDPSTLALLAPGMVDAGKAGVVWAQSGFSFPGESAAFQPMAAASAAPIT